MIHCLSRLSSIASPSTTGARCMRINLHKPPPFLFYIHSAPFLSYFGQRRLTLIRSRAGPVVRLQYNLSVFFHFMPTFFVQFAVFKLPPLPRTVSSQLLSINRIMCFLSLLSVCVLVHSRLLVVTALASMESSSIPCPVRPVSCVSLLSSLVSSLCDPQFSLITSPLLLGCQPTLAAAILAT